MLRLFTEYLLLYKKVCIPNVGTFEMVPQSATLDIADKVFTPPAYITLYNRKEFLTEHQVKYFSVYDPVEKERLKTELQNFGLNLKSRIEKESFEWNGFGTLRSSSDSIIFIPNKITLSSLQLLPAEKVIHEQDEHQVLVGDKEMTSNQARDFLKLPRLKKTVVFTLALIILALAVIVLLYILYVHDFDPLSLGYKMNIFS